MKKNHLGLFTAILMSMLMASAQYSCTATSKGVASNARPEKVYISLIDMLRDQSELTISGSQNDPTIRIRGNTSLVGDNEPLFVVNGSPVGTGFSSVSSLDVNNIESIRVLTRSQSGLYGVRGANGVVVIKTK